MVAKVGTWKKQRGGQTEDMREKRAEHVPTQENNDSITLGWNESQQEDILRSAVVALRSRLAQRRICMKGDFLVLGSDEVVDNVTSRC